MSELLAFRSEQGGTIMVEVAEPAEVSATRRGRPATAVVEAGESLDNVIGQLGPAIRGIVSQLRSAGPDEVEVEFAVKISADSNVIIARAGGEANFRVALRWSRDQGN